MSLPYALRLLCLCCASFFMIHVALAIATQLSAGTAVRVAERLRPSSAARLLFAVRMLPFGLTLFAVLAFLHSQLSVAGAGSDRRENWSGLFPDGGAGSRDLGAGNRAGR